MPHGYGRNQGGVGHPRAEQDLLTVESMPEMLREQHAVECDGQFVATGSMGKMNEAYRAFDIKYPHTVDLPVVG